MKKIRAAITGVGAYLPEYILDNEELSRMVDTSDEWITTRIGVKTRHILKGEGLGSSYMGVRAVRQLLEKTNTNPEDVDMLICATVTPDMKFPATANTIAYETGIINAFSFDLTAACSSFLYGMQTAASYIESGRCKKVVLVGADKMSSITNYKDRATCPIFGDAAAAVMMEPCDEEYGLQDSILRTDGIGGQYLYLKTSGSKYPVTCESLERGEQYTYQDGPPVYKYAVSKMSSTTQELMDKNHLTVGDIKYLVPHQANKRIIEAVAQRLNFPEEKCMINIQRYGNTTSATLPLCLWDYEKYLNRGDKLLFTTFGGGFTWGSIYLVWAYNGKSMAIE